MLYANLAVSETKLEVYFKDQCNIQVLVLK